MPDSSSNVEILLNIRAQGQSELAAAQAELAGLKAAATEASVSTANWSERMRQASIDAAAWNASTNNVGQAVRRTAADFAPATAAQREFSLRAEEAAINAGALERGLIQMTAGIERAVPGMGALGGETRALGMGAVATAGQVGLLNTVLIGTGIVGALAFAAAIAAITAKGIELQKTLQDVKAGVQGTLTTDSSNFGGGLAQAAGNAAVDQLVQSAKTAQVPISDLAKAFDQVFPAAARSNTTIQQFSNLLAQLISQEDALHIPQGKLVTDLEAIFNGTVRNTNALAQNLGITKEQAATARENGTTTDLLIQKEQEFAAAHETGSDTIARAQQKVSAAFEQLAAAAVKPIVEPLTNALNALSAAMDSSAPGFAAVVKYLGDVANEAVKAAQAIIQAHDALVNFASAAAAAVVASTKNVETGGGTGVSAITEGDTSGGFSPPYIPSDADNKAYADRLSQQEALQARGRKDAQEQVLPAVVVTGTGLLPPVGGEKGGGGGKKGPSQDTTDQKEISEIQAEINAQTEQYHSLIEQNNVAHKLGLTTLQDQDAANLKAGNDFIASIDASIAKLQAMKQAVEDVAAAHGGEDLAEKKQEAELDRIIAKLEILKGKTELANQEDTPWGQWDKGMRAFGDSLILTGAKAQQVFQGMVNTGINDTANALTGLITGTKNWAASFEQAGQSILNTLIKVELQNLAGIALQNSAQATERLSSAKTAAANVYASAASIPYVGWIIAPVAAAAAFAAVLAFAEGGVVEGPPSSTDNRIARVATGEGIVTARAVQYYGPQTIHKMNALTFASGGIVGGLGSSGGGAAARNVGVYNFFDKGDMMQHIISHPDLEKHILNVTKKNRFQIKV
jgi:hypothetical protein